MAGIGGGTRPEIPASRNVRKPRRDAAPHQQNLPADMYCHRLACRILVLPFSLLALTLQAADPAPSAGTGVPRGEADWRNSRVGGGGYITGLIPDPNTPGRIWARCDVAGVFLSEDGGRSFRAMNRGMTASSHHSVESFALSPHDPKILFRCSGAARGGKSFGFIHGSTDGGQTWRLLTEQADFIGNGEVRYLG